MTVQPRDFLTFAESIAADGENGVRAALSRAYYGAFHCAQNFHESLSSQGNAPRQEGVHGTLYQCLSNPSIPAADPKHTISRKIGVLGLHMHGLRIRADYRLDECVTQADKDLVIREAHKVFELASY